MRNGEILAISILIILVLGVYILIGELSRLTVNDNGTSKTIVDIGVPFTSVNRGKLLYKLVTNNLFHKGTNITSAATSGLVINSGSDGYLILLLFSLTYILKQTLSIPGSAILNLLAGAIFKEYSVYYAFILVCILTTVGASSCYFLSYIYGPKLVLKLFPQDKLAEFRGRVQSERANGNLLYYCLFSRLFPFTPNFFLNLASPLVGIDYPTFALSVLFGLAPYNFITVHLGAILPSLQSEYFTPSSLPWDKLMYMSVLAAAALVPVVAKKYLMNTTENYDDDETATSISSKSSSKLIDLDELSDKGVISRSISRQATKAIENNITPDNSVVDSETPQTNRRASSIRNRVASKVTRQPSRSASRSRTNSKTNQTNHNNIDTTNNNNADTGEDNTPVSNTTPAPERKLSKTPSRSSSIKKSSSRSASKITKQPSNNNVSTPSNSNKKKPSSNANSTASRRRRNELADLQATYNAIFDATPIKFMDGKDHTHPSQKNRNRSRSTSRTPSTNRANSRTRR